MVAEAAVESADRWWIIGSAAVILHGHHLPNLKDVDLLMSQPDAEAFLGLVGVVPGPGEPSDRFASAVFGTWKKPPIPVEIMGGFSLATDRGWQEISLATREEITVGNTRVFVPSSEELVNLLRLFGRPKDLERAEILRS
jgi:hypothetical protein